MPLKAIQFNSDRDEQYRKLYRYFVKGEKRQESLKIKVIMTILDRTDKRVHDRIRRHWNEFIKEHSSKHEYVVCGLKDNCPERYFVLAHKHQQAKHFYLFRTAIEKHNRHIENYRSSKQRKEGDVQWGLTFEESPNDHIPAIFDDEGIEYPEDPDSEVQVDDDEAGNIAESEEEEVDSDEEILEPISVPPSEEIVQSTQMENSSVHIKPRPIEPAEVPIAPIRTTYEPPRGTHSPPFNWKRKILPRAIFAVAIVVVVIVVIKYMYR